MKKLILTFIVALTATGFAQEEKLAEHCFSPKLFYRYHNEIGYSYKTSGAGFEYYFYQPTGINVKISAITNTHSKKPFAEIEKTILYRKNLSKGYSLYPILASKSSSHLVEKKSSEDIYFDKKTAFAGMGWEVRASDSFRFYVEAQGFRDLHNSFSVLRDDCFWGRSYSNPFGFRGKAGVIEEWKNNLRMEMEGYFSKTFSHCYKELGMEISIKWSL